MSLILQVLRTLGWEHVELRVKWTEETTGTLSAEKRPHASESMNWVLTNWQNRPRLCSFIAILEENITVRHSRGRILIFIILLDEKTRPLLRYLLPTVQAVPPPVSRSLPDTQRKVPNREGRTCKQRQYQGALGMLWRAEEDTSRAGWSEWQALLSQPWSYTHTTLPNSCSDKWHKEVGNFRQICSVAELVEKKKNPSISSQSRQV